MKKVIIEFTADDHFDDNDIKMALNANSAFNAISDIRLEVFRPARKHGYSDKAIDGILERNEEAQELISLLEDRFNRVLDDRGILDYE